MLRKLRGSNKISGLNIEISLTIKLPSCRCVQDFLICIEMVIVAFAQLYSFSYWPFTAEAQKYILTDHEEENYGEVYCWQNSTDQSKDQGLQTTSYSYPQFPSSNICRPIQYFGLEDPSRVLRKQKGKSSKKTLHSPQSSSKRALQDSQGIFTDDDDDDDDDDEIVFHPEIAYRLFSNDLQSSAVQEQEQGQGQRLRQNFPSISWKGNDSDRTTNLFRTYHPAETQRHRQRERITERNRESLSSGGLEIGDINTPASATLDTQTSATKEIQASGTTPAVTLSSILDTHFASGAAVRDFNQMLLPVLLPSGFEPKKGTTEHSDPDERLRARIAVIRKHQTIVNTGKTPASISIYKSTSSTESTSDTKT